MEKFTELLKHTFKDIAKEIRYCLEWEQGFSFDTGKLGERILFIVRNTKGIASNGGCAFDAKNGDEAKLLFLGQTYLCPDCGLKNNYYSTECISCGSTKRKDPNDTRWGIDAEAHFKYEGQIPCYIVTSVKPLNKDLDNLQYRLQTYKINSDNKFFNDMLKHQCDFGSKSHKNFMPFRRDFYMSSPIPLVDCIITCKNDDVNVEYDLYEPDNQTHINVMPIDIFTKKEKSKLTEIDGQVLISEAVEIIGVKNSTHGKERGTLNRNRNHK